MRIASWSWGGRQHVGTVSPDGRELTPLARGRRGARRAAADRGARARRAAAARRRAPRLPVERGHAARAAAAAAAQPLLRRPQLPRACRGAADHGVPRRACRTRTRWPIVFTKVPECVVGPHDDGAAARRRDLEPDRLRGRARGRHRPRRPRHRARATRWTTCSATRSSTT